MHFIHFLMCTVLSDVVAVKESNSDCGAERRQCACWVQTRPVHCARFSCEALLRLVLRYLVGARLQNNKLNPS